MSGTGLGREWRTGLRKDGSVKAEPEPCRWPRCEEQEKTAGFCGTHYQRIVFSPDLEEMIDPVYRKARCAFEGCENPAYAKGYCRNHNNKLLRSGSPEGSQVLKARQRARNFAGPLNRIRVKAVMLVLGITLEELGGACGVSREMVRQWINRSELDVRCAEVLVQRSGLSLEWFQHPELPVFVRDEGRT